MPPGLGGACWCWRWCCCLLAGACFVDVTASSSLASMMRGLPTDARGARPGVSSPASSNCVTEAACESDSASRGCDINDDDDEEAVDCTSCVSACACACACCTRNCSRSDETSASSSCCFRCDARASSNSAACATRCARSSSWTLASCEVNLDVSAASASAAAWRAVVACRWCSCCCSTINASAAATLDFRSDTWATSLCVCWVASRTAFLAATEPDERAERAAARDLASCSSSAVTREAALAALVAASLCNCLMTHQPHTHPSSDTNNTAEHRPVNIKSCTGFMNVTTTRCLCATQRTSPSMLLRRASRPQPSRPPLP